MKKRSILIIALIACLIGGTYGVRRLLRLNFPLPYIDLITEERRWSIGIYSGPNPFNLTYPEGISNPVLTSQDVTDVDALFVADPFMVHKDQTWYLFFEVLNTSTDQGDIGLATSTNGWDWEYQQIILDEPFHISYPYVFKYNSDYYMLPETHCASAVRLYRAIDFPDKWELVKELFPGRFKDPSLLRYNGKWWLFAQSGGNNLSLFYADNLEGPWNGHPKSPLVVRDKNISRPGGRMIVFKDNPIRYTQDCYPSYGNQLRAFAIDLLTPTDYQEHEIDGSPVLKASGSGWNQAGMHQLDPHRINEGHWIACVDGYPKRKKHFIFEWR